MRNLFATGILFFLSLSAIAQPTIEWQKCLGGSLVDFAGEIQETTDGGYIVTATVNSNNGDVTSNNGLSDFWIAKLLNDGTIEWEESFGGSDFESVRSVKQTIDGGYIMAGSTRSNDGDVTGYHGNFDCWIVKLSSLGALEWQRALGGSQDEIAKSIIQTPDGGYVLTGYTNSIDGDISGNSVGFNNANMWVVKLTSAGIISWEKSIGGSGLDEGAAIQNTIDGGYIVGGSSVAGNNGQVNFWVVKLSSLGTVIWENSFGGSDDDVLLSIQQTTDGGYILGGETYSNDGDVIGNQGYSDFWVVKLTCTGVLEWQKTLGGTKDDDRARVQQTSDGGYIVSGTTTSNNSNVPPISDIWLVKLMDKGRISWQKTIGGSSQDALLYGGAQNGAKQTSDGGFIVIGNTRSVDGDVSGNHGNGDCWVVKLSAFEVNESIKQTKLSVFPNPAVDHLNLELSEGLEGLDYTIHDYAGRIVSIGKIQEKCDHIDLSHLLKGVYFFQVSAPGDNLISRFVKM